MIVREFHATRKDGVVLFRTYSDQDRLIQKVGTQEIYSEAIDVENAPYQYVETDKPITREEQEKLGYEAEQADNKEEVKE